MFSEPENKLQWLPSKHVGSLLLLMFFATFRPSTIWPTFTLSLEPVTVVLIGLLLGYKVHATIGFKAFWQSYKVELLLLVSYFSVCFFSLYLNRHRYEDVAELIRYGVTFIVISAAFPAVIFLFLLPQNKSAFSLSHFKYSRYLPVVYLLLLALMAIWQYLDFDSSKVISQYFVSSEAWVDSNINGFFRISTDLASVLAFYIVLVLCGIRYMVREQAQIKLIAGACAVILVLLVAGALGGKRIFLLTLILGGLCFLPVFFKGLSRKTVMITILMAFVAMLSVTITMLPKLAPIFPFVESIMNGRLPDASSFTINLSHQASGRNLLWSQALLLLENNWWFGGSNGGFRLATLWHEDRWVTLYKEQNTHNVILQILVESGISGLLLLSILLVVIIKRNWGRFISMMTPVFIVLALVVDYFPDHSLPWIIAVGYYVALPWIFAQRKQV